MVDRMTAGTARPGKPTALVRNTLALMASTGATSVTGIVFWAVATRLFPVSAVGRASAEVSAMTLVGNIAQLNLSSAFIRFLPRAGDRTRSVVLLSYTGCSALAIAGSMLFLNTSLHHGIVPDGFAMQLVFTGSVVFWTIFVIQDSALVALRSTIWVPIENTAFGLAKLALLPLLITAPLAEGVFFAWTIPMVFAVVGVNILLFITIIPKSVVQISRPLAWTYSTKKALISFVTAEYLSSLVGTSATFIMPLVIIKRLGADAAGYFYLPWLISASFASLLWNITAPLIVAVSHDETALPELLRRSIRLMIILVIPSSCVVIIGAPYLLGMLSHKYSAQGTGLLRLIGASFPFVAILSMAIAALWIRTRIWLLLGIRTLRSVGLIMISIVLIGPFGLEGVGLANLAIFGVLAVAALPGLVHWYRLNQTGPGPVS